MAAAIALFEAMRSDAQLTVVFGQVVDVVTDTLRSGGKILLCGNGGSAADAQHLAGEFVGRFLQERAPYPAVSLSDNVAALTAISNDYCYASVFARSVRGLGARGDVLIGLSTSGRSLSVVRACEAAREIGVTPIAFVGAKESQVAHAAEYALCVPGMTAAEIQTCYMLVGHALCEVVEGRLSRS